MTSDLDRLAPSVDADAALGFVLEESRRRAAARRRLLVVGAAAIVVVLTAGVLAATRSGDDTRIAAGSRAGAVTVVSEKHGARVTLTLDRGTVRAGERVWADVTIENISDAPVSWEGGGCGIPATLTLVPTLPEPANQQAELWSGKPDELAGWLDDRNSSFGDRFGKPGERPMACTDDLRSVDLQPGSTLHMRQAADLRVMPGELPAGGRYQVVAEFEPYVGPVVDFSRARGVVRAVAPLRVEDDPRRKDADKAVEAFAGNRHLATYVDDLKRRTPAVVNVFRVEVTWRSGAWEFWADAMFDQGSDPKLRLRYDPEQGRIVEARIVHYSSDADDDPDVSRADSPYPPDEVLDP